MASYTKQEKQAFANLLKVASGKPGSAAVDKARAEIAMAIEEPLRKVLLSGDIVSGIFQSQDFTAGQPVMYPLDILTPGDEANYYAYVMPDHGRIPMRRVEGDYLMVPTYRIGNAIDTTLKIIRQANWPIVQRMLEIFELGFVKKVNDDGWQTLLKAAVDRNIRVNDPDANAGQFTPRLVTAMKTVMRRNAGGNSATQGRGKLTDLYISPEAHDDIWAWGLDLIPDAMRNTIFQSEEGLMNFMGVAIHQLDELGESQEYQTYYTSDLSGTMASSDLEIVVGLDRQREDSFVYPVEKELEVFDDPYLHRQGEYGVYGDMNIGFAVLDSRRVLIGSL